MNYDLKNLPTNRAHRGYTIKHPYGDMPKHLLMSKFEETNTADDEQAFDNYARGTITNWGPETQAFENEGTRRRATAAYGIVNHRYGGDALRGKQGAPRHSELFIGHIGKEDRDPRSIMNDPDMTQLAEQNKKRMRFMNWGVDTANEQVLIDGNRGEYRIDADKQEMYKEVRKRLKIFSQNRDAGRIGMRTFYKNTHQLKLQEGEVDPAIGERVGGYLDVVQKSGRMFNDLCSLQNQAWYRETANDQDLAAAKYSQIGRKLGPHNSLNTAAATVSEDVFKQHEVNKNYQIAALVMASMADAIKNTKFDADLSEGKVNAEYSGGHMLPADVSLIIREIVQGTQLAESDTSKSFKTSSLKSIQQIKTIMQDHDVPVEVATIIHYTQTHPGNLSGINKNSLVSIVTEMAERDPVIAAGLKPSSVRSSTWQKELTEVKINGRELAAAKYAAAMMPLHNFRGGYVNPEDFKKESDDSQFGRTQHATFKNQTAQDTRTDNKFEENNYIERHGRPMGEKTKVRAHTQNEFSNDMSEIGGRF